MNNDSQLLSQIQRSLLEEKLDVAPLLLKVRFLANRLGSEILERWVRYEAEGYPDEAEVPDFRKTAIAFTGHFSGAFGSGLRNAPIPNDIIEEIVGKQVTIFEIRQSIAEIDDLIVRSREDKSAKVHLPEANNLIRLLQGKIYPDYICNQVRATVPISVFAAIQSSVRSKLLDLTLELEKKTNAPNIKVDSTNVSTPQDDRTVVNTFTQQIVYGNNYAPLSLHSDSSTTHITVTPHDEESLQYTLSALGFKSDELSDLMDRIISDEVSVSEPIGPRIRSWLAAHGDPVIKNVLGNVLSNIALQFHGLI